MSSVTPARYFGLTRQDDAHVNFEITSDHRRWATSARRKYGHTIRFWLDLIVAQQGRCALSDAPLLFDSAAGTAIAGGHGVHPLYAAVDHIAPGSAVSGYQIISYDLNDLKGHLPLRLFRALQGTKQWNDMMAEWRNQAEHDQRDRAAFRHIRRS